jgi:hypothetical protein
VVPVFSDHLGSISRQISKVEMRRDAIEMARDGDDCHSVAWKSKHITRREQSSEGFLQDRRVDSIRSASRSSCVQPRGGPPML